MLLFQKSNKKVSSRKQIQIKEVRDDILILPRNEYRLVIETSSINFELKSEEEQDTIIDTFQNFLNSLSTQLQILIRVREVDVDHYLEQISKSKEIEKEKVYREQLDNYTQFIQKLVTGNKILSRRFYVIIPYHNANGKDFKLIKEQLYLTRDIVSRGLEKIGMKVKPLNTLELLDLFYAFYNPTKVKTQPLHPETVISLQKEAYV
ncbi:MAG TPA: TraC family protein [Patescibacteria group bacterium]|nr:TraC family protein [Patescibacteria group bacterium]